MDIQGPVLPAELLAPDPVHDGVPGHGHALVFQQQAQKFKFLVGQGNLLPCHPDHMALGADEKVPHLVVLGLRLLLRTAEDRPDPGHQLHHAEGLGDKVIGAAVQAHHPVILRVLRGEHDHRNALGGRRGPQLLQDGKAILLRQHNIQQDQGGLGALHRAPKIRRPVKALGLVALAAQGVNDQLANAVVVLQQVNSFHWGCLLISSHLTCSLQPVYPQHVK